MGCYKNLPETVLPGVNIVRELSPYPQAPVFEMEDSENHYVLKAALFGCHRTLRIQTEIDILNLVEGMPNIPSLVRDFGYVEQYSAFIKNFVEGVSLSQSGHRISDVKKQIELEDAVKTLHKRGVARLDLKADNVIETPEGNLFLTDLDIAVRKHQNPEFFNRMAYLDRAYLESNIFE